jgi:apolipoprotein N-acyltransferase
LGRDAELEDGNAEVQHPPLEVGFGAGERAPPHPETMNVVSRTNTKPSFRIALSSVRMQQASVALLGALLLALAFPKAGVAWFAPLGAAALFWSWEHASWKRAFALGWFAGWVFFTISFWWWSTTIKDDVGVFAYAAAMGGAAIEAVAIGAAGALSVLVRSRAAAWIAPLGVACAFAATEWIRSIGVIGVPFAQLGYTQADAPLRVFAAYAGTNGVTFVVCLLGAYLADAVARRTWRPFAVCIAAVVVAWVLAWTFWPARTLATATIPVAAVQGNIAQSLKFRPGMLQESIDRYTAMTRSAIARDPQLIVWPETVIPVAGGLNQDRVRQYRFTQLASEAGATIVVGSIDIHDGGAYNGLFIFTPHGLEATYDKRQLVPFAEWFPGKSFLWWIPYVGSLNGGFSEGSIPGVYQTTAKLAIAPLICWESAFTDLAYDQVRRGAQLLVISTDDAWFGTSSGPYQHAQIAQLRAVEYGMYVVRAAATGISGIIAPNGVWTAHAGLEQQAVVNGKVAPPVGSFFSRIGPAPVFATLVAIYALVLLVPTRPAHEA